MNAKTVEQMKRLEKGLKAACKRIADTGQGFSEAKTKEGWYDYYSNLPLESHETV